MKDGMKNWIKFAIDMKRRSAAYLDGLYPDGHLRQAKVNALRELQSASGEELSALMPSVLDRAFKRVF
jgi:hypothetical protein